MGGSSRRTTESTQTFTPPPAQQQNWDTLLGDALKYYQTGGPTFYPGQTYADPTATTLAGRQSALDYAGGVGSALATNAGNTGAYWLNNNNLFDFGNTPGYSGVRDSIIRDTTRNLTENILPASRSSDALMGTLGGSRQQQADALAMSRTSGEIADALAGLDLGVYGQNLGQQRAFAGLAPSLFSLGLAPGNVQQEVGAQQRADTQLGIDEAVQRHNFEQQSPLAMLQLLQSLSGTAGQYGGTTSGKNTETQSGGNGWMQGLGAALSIASLFMPYLAPVAAGVNAAGSTTTGGLNTLR